MPRFLSERRLMLASVVYMTANPVHHCHTKHIEIGIYFIREEVAMGQSSSIAHVSSSHQFTDMTTLPLSIAIMF